MRIATLSLLALTALPGFASAQTSGQAFPATLAGHARSEERRVGKECRL